MQPPTAQTCGKAGTRPCPPGCSRSPASAGGFSIPVLPSVAAGPDPAFSIFSPTGAEADSPVVPFFSFPPAKAGDPLPFTTGIWGLLHSGAEPIPSAGAIFRPSHGSHEDNVGHQVLREGCGLPRARPGHDLHVISAAWAWSARPQSRGSRQAPSYPDR